MFNYKKNFNYNSIDKYLTSIDNFKKIVYIFGISLNLILQLIFYILVRCSKRKQNKVFLFIKGL